MLNPQQVKNAAEIAAAAIEVDKSKRADFVAAKCDGDADVRVEVESLLAFESAAADFIERPAVEVDLNSFVEEAEATLKPGALLGNYRVVSLLGEGGMAEVYLAERADEQFQKRVAIKLIKRGLDTNAIQRRFRREREILASLEHPNIARLLDAGTTADGLSYFVMECVEGQPITEFCVARKLSLDEQLRLFCIVCDAVSYAHQHLVVHRDLKPSNILVTSDGAPKLLDFGIAKLLAPDQTQLANTIPEERVLTRDYASPEQLGGERVTTAADVYSLGIVLRELIGDEKSSRGDLRNIISKAVQPEPARRYSSPRHLAEEIERYLRGLPVVARGDTFGYRAGKFIHRNRLAVAAVSLIALSLIAGLIATKHEANVARREQQKAERINSFLASTLAEAGPSLNKRLHRGEPNSLVEVLNSAAARLEGEFAHDLETRADLERIISGAYASEGQVDLAKQHLEKWIALAAERYPADHPKALLATADRAGNLFFTGKLKESEELFRQTIPKLRAAYAKGAISAEELAESLNCLAYLRRTRGDSAEAERLFRETLAVKPATSTPFHYQLETTLSTLALTLLDEGKFAEALSTSRDAVREQEQSAPKSGTLGFALTVLGGMLTENGDFAQADAALSRAETILRELLVPSSLWLGDNLRNHAASFYAQGRHAEALTKVREALEIYRRSFGPYYDNYPTALDIEGLILAKSGHVAEGEKLLREALSMREETLTPGHFWVALAQGALGECLTLEHRYSEAQPLLVASYESLQRTQGSDNPRTKMAQQRLATLQQALGKAGLPSVAAAVHR